jgi:transcription elongation GreA/GreB family factor|tara:strand:- start:27360 stop:28088 length:729 start_codon:yes stop_codon:yes gene_type:complete
VIASVESLGFEAVPQVGVSNYFIDIGVKHPNYPFGYLCGVECDGAAYHSSKVARDRDRLREEVLQRLGWELYRIWSTDWFRDPHGERRKLGDYLETMLAIKIASMPEIVEPEISEVEEVPMENSGLIQADDKEINVPAAVNEGDTEPEPIPTAITTANDRKGPITPGSKVRIRYLNGPRAGVEARFWLTDLSEEHIAEVPGYTTVRQTAPICQSMFGAYEGDLVSYDLQNNEVGVEILEVEL